MKFPFQFLDTGMFPVPCPAQRAGLGPDSQADVGEGSAA